MDYTKCKYEDILEVVQGRKKVEYSEREEAIKAYTTKSFNGKDLFPGDNVICIFGAGLRNSVIESISDYNGYAPRIKMKGLKNPICSNKIIK